MDLCCNYSCDRAGWCKRITYPYGDTDVRKFFDCAPENDYWAYRKNKARQIYERDYKDEVFRDVQSEQEEYQNNYRQPGLWENDPADTRVDESREIRYITPPNSILQFQRSSDRGSSPTSTYVLSGSSTMPEPDLNILEQYLGSLVTRRHRLEEAFLDGIEEAAAEAEPLEREALRDCARQIRERIDAELDGETFIEHQIRRSEILQDTSRDGISPTEPVSGQPDD